ncbi:MAG: saccharopine dehydrogenase NADP-binding domain-containing protein [Acidobacteria bacterium]|nr:saccharopine dehydrogenase NADP-binding domain-containing protein [Acidobacteriota bacterium]
MHVLVLGGGVVGEAVAWDLTHTSPVARVTVADADQARLEALRGRLDVDVRLADLSDVAQVARLAVNADVTVGALPSTLALAVIEARAAVGGRHVDVSFLAEDPRRYDAAARASGAVIQFDCGIAPGVSHVLVGEAVIAMARTATVRIDVGGLPQHPVAPFFYKAPFAAVDVIEEYTRPARLVRAGQPVTLPALSEPDTIVVDGVGPLESFNTDGLRSLMDTVRADHMVERTLRYPGHLAMIQALSDAGCFATTPVRVGELWIEPRRMTAAVLFPQWAYAPGERDLTVLRVETSGVDDSGGAVRRGWELVDRVGADSPLSSMARTTGLPAAIVARWLVDGTITTPGVHPPERLGLTGFGPALRDALRQRGIAIEPT